MGIDAYKPNLVITGGIDVARINYSREAGPHSRFIYNDHKTRKAEAPSRAFGLPPPPHHRPELDRG